MVGVFGVIGYSVVLGTAEIGLRSAIGATPAAILRLVMGEACDVATTGAIVSTVVAAVAMRGLSSLLFGVTAGDVRSYVVPAMAVIALTLAALCITARRASRVDVVAALRLR
jgi:ABC-type antimicrobial peptide transport system permease subunit